MVSSQKARRAARAAPKRIAASWADHRKVPQIAFKPDWTKHAKAAPFKRNDQFLEVLPIGVMVFPGTGIQGNLADKAKKLGVSAAALGPVPRNMPPRSFQAAQREIHRQAVGRISDAAMRRQWPSRRAT